MRFFTLLLDPDDRGITVDIREAYEVMLRGRGLRHVWQALDHAAVLTAWDDPHGDPLLVQNGHWFAVGMVRLDNRGDLRRWGECERGELTDLELVLRVVARHGTKYIPQMLGDFGFVVWDVMHRAGIAACDAFAVKRLYYTKRHSILALASRAEALALEKVYEVGYLTELLVRGEAPRELSVYAGVRPVPAASMVVLERGALSVRQYWNAADCEVDHARGPSEREAIDTCRQLLTESVRLRLGNAGETWAQLSGGLDSSSVASLVQWLAGQGEITHGLAGTVTVVDLQGSTADERTYSDAVVQRWQLRNEVIVDSPTWYEQGQPLPRIDQPRFDFVFHPRDRRMCSTIRNMGGRVLLTGWGGDELFMGSMLFFADWMAQGRVWPAVCEMAHRAAIGRVSFWELAYRNALLPLLPRMMQQGLVYNEDDSPIQPWLERATMRRYGLTWQSPTVPEYRGRLGHKYRHAVLTKIASLPLVTDHGIADEILDLRHPLLYRPLVEFAVSLPPDLRARPHAHRWVLREAMRGILPELVRRRVGKPDTGEVLAWSLATERARLAPLLDDPILAELGVLDRAKLREAFESASHQTGVGACMHLPLLSTLAVEAWLQMRSGRWPRGGQPSSTEAEMQVH